MASLAPPPARVLVIGTGLIGTSVALALRARGTDVWLSDVDASAAEVAAGLGAGTAVADLADAKGIADIAVLAMPPDAVARMLALAQETGVADWYTDVASVKSLPLAGARELGCDLESYVPGHPLAGRERHGPAAARADLFQGRTWALCPLPENAPGAVAAVSGLAEACGAELVVTDAATHDRWVALVSHAPHVVSAAMAARLGAPGVPGQALKLAGGGLRDVTRIAAGDVALWLQILSANAVPVAEILSAVADDLAAASRSLAAASGSAAAASRSQTADAEPGAVPASVPVTIRDAGPSADAADISEMSDLLNRGREGVARIPGKHGGQARNFAVVQAVIADRPGELARVFGAAEAAQVNVEDVRIEHSPGLPTGVIEISVRPDQARALLDAMTKGGWTARKLSPSPPGARIRCPPVESASNQRRSR
jgi:prephenate dehydrogenase